MPKLCEGYAARIEVPTGTRDVQVFDDDLPGFGIRKFESGRASYFVKYNVGTQQRRLTLGKVTRGNFAEMKRQASRVLAKARLGQDAVAEKRAAIGEGQTLGALVETFLEDRTDLRPRYHLEITRHLEQHWKPLHSMKVRLISRQDIVRVIDDLADDHGKGAADRARSALSSFFSWCVDRQHCETNPTMNIMARGSNAGRDRVLSLGELVEVWRACLDDDYGRIVKLLMLTLQRRGEIGDLGDSEIEAAERQISLPAHRTKNGRPHLVPLSDLALEVLESAPRREKRDLIFGSREGGFSGWSKAKHELDERIAEARRSQNIEKDMAPWVLHDLRRSGVTHLHELGFAQPHVVEAIVNHVSGHQAGVAGVYNKALYLDERRNALGLWATYIASLLPDDAASDEDTAAA